MNLNFFAKKKQPPLKQYSEMSDSEKASAVFALRQMNELAETERAGMKWSQEQRVAYVECMAKAHELSPEQLKLLIKQLGETFDASYGD
jgi:hypothetical protein